MTRRAELQPLLNHPWNVPVKRAAIIQSRLSEHVRLTPLSAAPQTVAGIDFARGLLAISEPMATPIIRQLKRWKKEAPDQIAILDAPPGASCSVVETVRGCNLVLLVTEPTVSGVHDLERILGTVRHFRVPALVLINKADINPANAANIEAFCQAQGIPLVGRLPLTTSFHLTTGRPRVRYML